MTVLILGGTADARRMASHLYQKGLPLIYSVAGLVRRPDVACKVVSGGFRQFGGLENYIHQEQISAILDATHPYAQKMSQTAVETAQKMAIPCWQFQRPPWLPKTGDNWQEFTDWQALLPAIKNKKSVFFTAGQLGQEFLTALSVQQVGSGQKQLLRTALTPKHALLPTMSWIKAIGPFDLESERAILVAHKVDALVSKNSGGASTQAKLEVARELNIPVLMLTRPELADPDVIFSNMTDCEAYVLSQCH